MLTRTCGFVKDCSSIAKELSVFFQAPYHWHLLIAVMLILFLLQPSPGLQLAYPSLADPAGCELNIYGQMPTAHSSMIQTHMAESTPDLSFSWVTNQKHEASSPSLCMPLWIPGKTLSPLPVYSSASNLLCFLSHQECGARLPCMQTDTLWKGPSSKNMHRTSLWIRRDGVRRKSEVGKDRTGFSL